MQWYLKEAINDCNLSINKVAATPARKTLFELKEDSPLLGKEQAESFQSIVSKLMYVGLHSRPDLLAALCFLSTRVSKPTEQDQDKLRRCLQYVHGTLDLTLTLSADDLSTMHTYVNVAYTCKS